MDLFTPDVGLLFWMLLSFGVVFFVLAKWGFPVITRMVDSMLRPAYRPAARPAGPAPKMITS